MPPELPVPSRCKWCPAQIRWCLWPERYKKLPLEVTPDPSGPWVVVKDDVLQELLALPYDAAKHGSMPRYRSHLERCQPRPRPPSMLEVRKPDPTAGMKFPRAVEDGAAGVKYPEVTPR